MIKFTHILFYGLQSSRCILSLPARWSVLSLAIMQSITVPHGSCQEVNFLKRICLLTLIRNFKKNLGKCVILRQDSSLWENLGIVMVVHKGPGCSSNGQKYVYWKFLEYQSNTLKFLILISKLIPRNHKL